jgi:putative DNA primase/helicase
LRAFYCCLATKSANDPTAPSVSTDPGLVLVRGPDRDSIYALANGVGKQRARRDGSLQDPKGWRVFLLSSGELPNETKIAEDNGRRARAGQTIRLLDVHVDRGFGFGAFDNGGQFTDASKLADAIKDAARSAYGTAGPEFVRHLMAAGVDEVATEAKRAVTSFVAQFVPPRSSEQIGRAAKKFALIGVAGGLATGLGVTPWERGEAQRAARWAFERWLETRGGTSSHEERQAIEQVRLLIEKHGDARFECADGSSSTSTLTVCDQLGWRKGEGDKREWWVQSEIWKTEFCAGLSPTSVAKALADSGILRRQDGKNLACIVRPPGGKTMRCYVLTAAILNDGVGANEPTNTTGNL